MIPYAEPWQVYDDPGNRWNKRRSMPFAVVGGIVSTALAVSTAAAATTAIGTAVAVAAAVASAASVVMTVVALATGDQELKKIAGYVGLAGGVLSLGAGIAGAMGGAAGAGSSATTAAKAGTTAVDTAKTGATTAANTGSGAAANAGQVAAQAGDDIAVNAAQQGANALPSATTTPLAPATTQTIAPIAQGSNVGVDVGAKALANAGDAVVTKAGQLGSNLGPASNSGGFFDFLKDAGAFVKDNKEIVELGGKVVGGVGDFMKNSSINDAQNAYNQNALNFRKEQYYGNMPGMLPISSREPTLAETAQYQRDQAALARQQAQTLTGKV